MKENIIPSSGGTSGNADPGEPDSGYEHGPLETPNVPPFTTTSWNAPSRLSRLMNGGITVTLRITPYLITAWIFAPAEVKYELRKQARWLPWMVKYATWWLKQEGF